ncbi:MAG: TraB/GumN family protein [Clostridia bacterium]|nr:TraB/GumN family protein [Clostridia bacterium]
MKRIIAIFLLFCLLFCGCHSAQKQPVQTETVTESATVVTEQAELVCRPLLYKVTSEGGGTLYLFGSIHAADKRAKPLPGFVMDAYRESSYLAVECDTVALTEDMDRQIQLMMAFLCESGMKTEDYLGNVLYTKLKDYLSTQGLYAPAYDLYTPAMWMSLAENAIVEQAGLDANKGIDTQLLKKAHKEEKEIREVESAEFQYTLLANLDLQLLCIMLEEYVDHAEDEVAALTGMYEAWLAGDEEALLSLVSEDAPEELTEEELALYENYNKAMITDRNLHMLEVAEGYLKEKTTGFMVVGAAHVLGDGALVSLLQERGYTVELVAPYD